MDEGRAQLGAAAVRDQIYVAGGASVTGPLSSFDSFDTVSEAWRPLPPLPEGLQLIGMAALGDLVILTGGFSSSAPDKHSARVWIYDTRTAQWRRANDMPGGRAGHALLVHDGAAYVIGGHGDGATQVWRYQPAKDVWSVAFAPLPEARPGLAAVVVNGKFYVIGGQRPDGSATSEVLILDPANGRWVEGPELPVALSGHTAAFMGGAIHVTGGSAPPVLRTSGAHYVLDPSKGVWEEGPALPTPRQGLTSAAVANRWFVIGGSAGFGFFSAFTSADAVEIFSPN